jgi:hypothetical protein
MKEEIASSWPAPDERIAGRLDSGPVAALSYRSWSMSGCERLARASAIVRSRLSYDIGHSELVVNPRAGDAGPQDSSS